VRKLPAELFGTIDPPFGVSQHHQRNRRVKLVVEQPLMGRGVIECHKRLVGLLKLCWGGGQRELVVVQPSLHIEVRFHPIQIAFTFGTLNELMVNL
jgi:hypothetical protein